MAEAEERVYRLRHNMPYLKIAIPSIKQTVPTDYTCRVPPLTPPPVPVLHAIDADIIVDDDDDQLPEPESPDYETESKPLPLLNHRIKATAHMVTVLRHNLIGPPHDSDSDEDTDWVRPLSEKEKADIATADMVIAVEKYESDTIEYNDKIEQFNKNKANRAYRNSVIIPNKPIDPRIPVHVATGSASMKAIVVPQHFTTMVDGGKEDSATWEE